MCVTYSLGQRGRDQLDFEVPQRRLRSMVFFYAQVQYQDSFI